MVDSYRFLFFLLFYFLILENFEKSSIEKTNQTVEKVEVKSWFPLFIFLKFNLKLCWQPNRAQIKKLTRFKLS